MQLTLHADYAFRVLIYLGARPGELVPTHEISEAYGISKHHLVRVVQTLEQHGYVDVHAGRWGGVTLARAPQKIRLGQVLRDAESNLRLAECFDHETNTCPISGACALKGMLAEALDAFVSSLDRYTLADVLTGTGSQTIRTLLSISNARP